MFNIMASAQKHHVAAVALAALVGWILAVFQLTEVKRHEAALETAQQERATAEQALAKAEADLAALERERVSLEERVAAAGLLQEITAQLEAGKSELASLRSGIERVQVELRDISVESESARAQLKVYRAETERQQALAEGSELRFKTTARARVRAGPSTDTEEVAVVPAGKAIQVFEIVEDGTWYKVGGMGYVFHELLEPVEK